MTNPNQKESPKESQENQESQEKQQEKAQLLGHCSHPTNPAIRILIYHLPGSHFYTCISKKIDDETVMLTQVENFPYDPEQPNTISYALTSVYRNYADRIVREAS